MRKIFLLFGIFLIFNLEIFAKPIDVATAKIVGQSFLSHSTNTLSSTIKLNLVYTSLSNSSLNAEKNPSTYFYIFNNESNGFVIVSADDNVLPILAYSNEANFVANNMPQNIQKWLEEYIIQIRFVIDNNISATKEIQDSWDNYLNGKPQTPNLSGITALSGVIPLITTKWDQTAYYNDLCPTNTVTGCVATAMAQILKYWNYPATGTGFHTYQHPIYGTLSANFGNTNYQWSAMPNIINNTNNAVATLMYQVGVSVDMDYGTTSTGGSGAYVISAQSPVQHCSEYALKTYFGYKNSLQGLERVNYNQSQWLNLLKNELDASRPVLYAGYGSFSGHCFVADGYDNNDFFHINWGWSGNSDGYFLINALNPGNLGTGGGAGGFNTGHQMVIGIEPDNSGTPSQSIDLQLDSYINMYSTQIGYGNPLDVTININNLGSGNFSGDYAAVVFDQNDNFLDFIEVKTGMTLNAGNSTTTPLTFNNSGSTTLVPGAYYIAIFYRIPTQNWILIGDGNYNNNKQFEIIYETEIETNSAFYITNNLGRLIQDSTAIINIDILNTGNVFYGAYRLILSNLDGSFAQNIQVLNESNGLQQNANYIGGKDFTGMITVAPGSYLMELEVKEQGIQDWYPAGSSSFQNSILVTVEAPSIFPDQYEENDSLEHAYTLPISFIDNTANVNTMGSNFHSETDIDYFKINLTSGNSYIISARLQDSYNSINGNEYTVDGLFSYSLNGGINWSENYDDIMHNNIHLQDGGTVYFRAIPFYSEEMGTYLLEMRINKMPKSTGMVDILGDSDLIKVFPNPAKDFLNIDFKEIKDKIYSIKVLNLKGQELITLSLKSNDKNLKLPLLGLSDGIYFIQLHSDIGIINKKFIIKK